MYLRRNLSAIRGIESFLYGGPEPNPLDARTMKDIINSRDSKITLITEEDLGEPWINFVYDSNTGRIEYVGADEKSVD